MGEIIPMNVWEQGDLYQMDRAQLQACLNQVREQIALWDQEEPENMDSEAYEAWGDRREELEDLMDEILDRLDS